MKCPALPGLRITFTLAAMVVVCASLDASTLSFFFQLMRPPLLGHPYNCCSSMYNHAQASGNLNLVQPDAALGKHYAYVCTDLSSGH